MFDTNPVTRYVFNLDDIQGVAGTVGRAADGLGEAAGSIRAAGRACAELPGIGADTAATAAALAGRLEAAETGLRADGRWLAATVGRLAAVDAGFWVGTSLGKAVKALDADRTLARRYDRSHPRRLGNLAGLGVDLFGEEVTGSKLPATALKYYRAARSLRRVDRMLWQLRYPVAWYGQAATDAVRGAAGRATGPLRKLVDQRARNLAAGPSANRKPDLIRRLAGEGHGVGRLRRVANWAVPGASIPLVLEDGRQLFTQKHHGARGALEVFRDTTATVGSGLHAASDVLNVVPVAGTVADKGIDVAVFAAFDGAVMGMDAVDHIAFEKGDDIVHAVGDAGGWAGDRAGDAVDAVKAIGGLL